MQVSHVHDHVTHAVIGGQKAVEFGISSSAEFFHILSSTLYKDQILAVVREVLCNAWDAHIEAGCTDKPVEITLTEDKFVIRDFGTGIHHDDMGPIYGTYGNSTKKNDGKQTGGFGLGCKAPFAYTEHFEVISHHAGVKTIYNLSKSSGQVLGKPGIIPIAAFPTAESGLQVTIPIKNLSDRARFQHLIERIARNGDMHMQLNGQLLGKLGFDASQAPYLITQERPLDHEYRVMVRYGNVVYPVDRTPEIGLDYDRIISHLGKLSERYTNYSILFQAPPHSISVTPSRETLSMQEHTLNTLRTLFGTFLQTMGTAFPAACEVLTREAAHAAAQEGNIATLLSRDHCLPRSKALRTTDFMPPRITDLAIMAQRYLAANYPSNTAFRKKDLTYRLGAMVQENLVDRGLVQSFLKELKTVPEGRTEHCDSGKDWLHRRIIGRLVSKLMQQGIDPRRLHVYDPSDRACLRGYGSELPLVPVYSSLPASLFAALPYLRNIVVVTPSRTNLSERIRRHDTMRRLGHYPGFLVYHTSMKKAEKEAVLAFFAATRMTVVDLTVKQGWEVLEEAVKPAPVPRKKAADGIPLLKAMLVNQHVNTAWLLSEDIARTTTPEFVVNVSLSSKAEKTSLGDWGRTCSRYIVDLYGDKGGITNNSAVAERWFKKGAKPLDTYVLEKILPAMETHPAIQAHWAHRAERVIESLDYYDYDTRALIQLIYASPALSQLFGLPAPLAGDELKIVRLWSHCVQQHAYRLPDEVKRVRTQLEAIPLAQCNLDLLARIRSNPLRELLDMKEVERVLKTCKPDSAEVKTTIEIVGKLFS